MSKASAPRGNFVSEWYGHRVFPVIASQAVAFDDQRAGNCPFLTGALGVASKCVKAWIYVFDISATAMPTPNRLVLKQVIATNAEAVSHFALKVAPAAAAAGVGSSDRVLSYLRTRILEWWPTI